MTVKRDCDQVIDIRASTPRIHLQRTALRFRENHQRFNDSLCRGPMFHASREPSKRHLGFWLMPTMAHYYSTQALLGASPYYARLICP